MKTNWSKYPKERCEDYENAFSRYMWEVLTCEQRDELEKLLQEG